MPDPAAQNPLDANGGTTPAVHHPDGATLPVDQFRSSLAVVIGIDAYGGGIPPLTTAVNDATRLAELLRTAHGYETLLLTESATGQPEIGRAHV